MKNLCNIIRTIFLASLVFYESPLLAAAALPDLPSPDKFEVHAISVNDAGRSSSPVDVSVTFTDAPVVLLLGSSWPVRWNISAAPGVNILSIILLNSANNSSRIDGLNPMPPLSRMSVESNFEFFLQSKISFSTFIEKAIELTGKAPTTLQTVWWRKFFAIDGVTTTCRHPERRGESPLSSHRPSSPRSFEFLLTQLESPQIKERQHAASAFKAHCDKAIPSLVRLLVDPEPLVRNAAAKSLLTIGIPNQEWHPQLTNLTDDPDPRVRLAAINGEPFVRPDATIPSLIKALQSQSEEIRLATILALDEHAKEVMMVRGHNKDGDITRKAIFKSHVQLISPLLKDPNLEIKINTAWLLRRLHEISRQSIPALAQALEDPNPAVKEAVASAFESIGIDTANMVLELVKNRQVIGYQYADRAISTALPDVLPDLAQALRQAKSDEDRLNVVTGIRLAQKPYPPLAPLLVELSDSTNGELISQIDLALSVVGAPGLEEIPPLIRFLGHKSAHIREHSAKSLAQAKELAWEAAPVLVSILLDSEKTVRTQAMTALKAIGGQGMDQLVLRLLTAKETEQPQLIHILASMDKRLLSRAGEAAPMLILLLDHTDKSVRTEAASLLKEIGVAAVEPLVMRLSQSKGIERSQLNKALSSMGDTIIPILNQIMIDTKAPLASRLEALRLVESFGEKGSDAIHALTSLLKDQLTILRVKTAQVLGGLGPLSSQAIPSLIENLGDTQEEVRQAALVALQRIGPDALPALTTALGATDPHTKIWASRAIAGIDLTKIQEPDKSQFRKDLAAAMGETDSEVRFQTAVALARMHIPEPQAIATLASALSDHRDQTRLQAIRALGKIAPAALSTRDLLFTLSKTDESQAVKTEAAVVLERMRLFEEPGNEPTNLSPQICAAALLPEFGLSLRNAHTKALAIYKQQADGEQALRILLEACIHQAITSQPESLARAEYAVMLNDFAFFELEQYKKLSFEQQRIHRSLLDDAITTLTKVLELIPRRAVAHLNMGEALQLRSRFLQFDALVRHYKTYKDVSGKSPDAISEWLISLPRTIDACQFSAALRNKGWLNDALLIKTKGLLDIDNDGLTDSVTLLRDEAKRTTNLQILYGNPDRNPLGLDQLTENYKYEREMYGSRELMPIAFKGKFYVLNYNQTSHGVTLTHLEEFDGQGSKVLCEFSNTAGESVAKSLDKNTIRMVKDVLRGTFQYNSFSPDSTSLNKEEFIQLKTMAKLENINVSGALEGTTTVDIDNDGTPDELALLRFSTPDASDKTRFVLARWNASKSGFASDTVNRSLAELSQEGFTVRSFVWSGGTYLEKQADVQEVFSHEIYKLTPLGLERVVSFNFHLESKVERYGKHPAREKRLRKDLLRVVPTIPR
jgi:HEAT repeat protein